MNICADCQNPIGSCSWEKSFIPVPGWTAVKTKVLVASPAFRKNGTYTESYDVRSCPLFLPPPGYPRKQVGIAKPVIAKNIVTGEETIYPSIKKASVALGATGNTVTKCIGHGGILYGHTLRYAKVGDGK